VKLNQVAYLQAEVANAYMRQHRMKPAEFVELDREYGILHYIEIGYGVFHLTGTQGILEEVEAYIRSRKGRA
jgi:hypothetical protein